MFVINSPLKNLLVSDVHTPSKVNLYGNFSYSHLSFYCCYLLLNSCLGTCAVIISNEGKDRSLCANLAACNKFTIDHIKKPENSELIKKADYYYVTVSYHRVT